MINRIIDFSIENKAIILLLIAAACVAGWWSMKNLAPGCHPGLERYAGHYLFALGPQP